MQHHFSRFILSLVRALSLSALSSPLRVRALSRPLHHPNCGVVCVRACPRGCLSSQRMGERDGTKSVHTSRTRGTLTCSQTCRPTPWASHPCAPATPSTIPRPSHSSVFDSMKCVYYCSTCYKAVRVGGTMEDITRYHSNRGVSFSFREFATREDYLRV
jgi:hypothetical protein